MQRSFIALLKSNSPALHAVLKRLRNATLKTLWNPQVSRSLREGLPLTNRSHLPLLLTHLGLRGEGVEVGVLNGYFSELILIYSELFALHSIDPWREFDEERYRDKNNVKQQEQEGRFQATRKRLAPYGERSQIHRMTSKQAAESFTDASLDFVYIDANHSYEACKEDIELWWPKVKTGGVMAGHDYLDGEFPGGNFGVKRAADEFIVKANQHLFVIRALWPTWYVIKR